MSRAADVLRIVGSAQPCSIEQIFSLLNLPPNKVGTRGVFKTVIRQLVNRGQLVLDDEGFYTVCEIDPIPTKSDITDRKIIEYLESHGESTTIEIGDGIGVRADTVRHHLRWLGCPHVTRKRTNYYYCKEKEDGQP